MNTLDLASKKVNLKKVASTNGGEWQGPCPSCGGNDRFHVWPNQNEGKGGYWCRGCEKAGDNIQFLIDFEGMNFKEACAYLNITMADRPADFTPSRTKGCNPLFQPVQHSSPAALWQEKAGKFVTWAQENLKSNKFTLTWLADRGITAVAAEQAKLGWNPGEDGKDIYRARKAWGLQEILKDDGKPRALWIPRGLVIPYCPPPAGVAQSAGGGVIQRIRIRRPEGEPRYYVVPGSAMPVMIIGRDRRAFVVVESELDAIACAAACPLAGAIALGSVSAKPDAATFAILKGALQILNALDYDRAGAKAMEWWTDQFDKCDRWPTPQGKDPGEAYALGIDLNSWIEEGLPPVLTIKAGAGDQGTGNREKKRPQPAQSPAYTGGVAPMGAGGGENKPPQGTPPLLSELWQLLRDNPSVKIINTPDRFTVLRNDRYVGGRINHLVFREKEVTDYILNHPDAEIGWQNLFVIPERAG